MLSEVYKWFNENLKDKRPTSATLVGQKQPETNVGESVTSMRIGECITFELYADLPTGFGPVLLCPMVSFGPGWLRSTSGSRNHRLFWCCCSQRIIPRSLSEEDITAEVHKEQLQFSRT
jgi:hypothetical protein